MQRGDLFSSVRHATDGFLGHGMSTSRKENEKWGFEIQQGVASIFREKKNNEISTKKYNVWDFLPKILMRFFSRIGNLIFLLVAILMFCLTDYLPYQTWMNITFEMLMLAIYITLEFVISMQRKSFDQSINNQKTRRGGKKSLEDLDENVLWKELDVGDIVYLLKDETVPADMIILDTSEIYEREAICYVDTAAIDGTITFAKKKASGLSQILNRLPSKNNYKEFRKGLSGKIEYQSPSARMNEFLGYFRLKKDPKVETLTVDNFVPRGSTIKNTDWIFGLIVYTGFDTKIMMNSNYKRHKISFIEYLTQIYFLLSVVVTFFFALINTIATIARVKAYNIRDNVQAYGLLIEADSNIDDTGRFFVYLLLYTPVMPLFLYGFLDLVNYIQKLIIEFKMNHKFKGETCKILDPFPFVNIGQIKYALIDKTGTLTTSIYRINQIFFHNKVYKFKVDPRCLLEHITEQEKIKYFSSPFKNTSSKGEVLFANNLLLTSVNHKEQTIVMSSEYNMKHMKRILSKIDESQLDLEDVSVHSDQEQINEIKEDNVFCFKRDIERLEEEKHARLRSVENEDKSRSTSEIVRRLLGQEAPRNGNSNSNSPLVNANKIEIQIPQMYKTQEISSSKKAYESLNNSAMNDQSQISFRNKEDLAREESLPLKPSQSPKIPNRSKEMNPYEHLYHTEKDFLADLLKTNADKNLDSLFEALTLCHGARTHRSSTKVISGRREDEVILDFCKKLYFSFDKTDNPENPSQYYCKYKTQKLVYTIFGINDFSAQKKCFSVVLKSPINEELFLICKGEEDSMRGLISMNKKEMEIYDFLIKDMQNQGLKPIVYAKKLLTNSETQAYYNQMKNLKTSLITQTEEMNILGRSLEKNMELLLIIGLKDELNEGVEEMIELFKDTGVNVWMVSGDCKENVIASAYASRICNPLFQKPREITVEDESELNVIIRNYLIDVKNIYNAIKTQFQTEAEKTQTTHQPDNKLSRQMSTYLYRLRSERNGSSLLTQNQRIFHELQKRLQIYYIILNGKSLEIIMNDVFLKAHFVFLISLVRNVIAYNLSAEMKAHLVTIIQNHFIGKPSVLAIGDNYNDALMLQKADIGLELIKKSAPLEKRISAGDIQISSLKFLKPLMLIEGPLRIVIQENLIFFLFYQSFLLGITLFLFYWYSSLDLSVFSFTFLIFFYFLFFSTPTILLSGIFDRPVDGKVLTALPGLYSDGKIRKRFIGRRFIIRALIDSLLHAALIFYVSLYSLRSSNIEEDGLNVDFNSIVLSILISLIIVNNLKLTIRCLSNGVYLALLSFIISLIMVIFFFFAEAAADRTWCNWSTNIYYIFSNMQGIMLVAEVVIICLLISFIVHKFLAKYFIPNLYTIFSNPSKVGMYYDLINENITSYYDPPREIGTYVKDIFTNVESLDPTIQEMFTPADINVNEIELNRYSLAIQKKSIENKYNFLTKKDHIKKVSGIILLMIVIFGIYTVCILIIRSQKNYGFISLAVFLFTLLLWCATLSDLYKKFYYGYTKLFFAVAVSAKLALDWIGNPFYVSLSAVLVPHITTANLNLGIVYIFAINAAYFVSYFVSLLLIYYQKYPTDSDIDDVEQAYLDEFDDKTVIFYSTWNFVIYLSCINILSFYGLYKFEKLKRSEFLAKTRIETEANNVQDILAILVPKFVKDRMTHGETTMQEAQDDVGILFCDICDFDKVINSEGTKVVEMLDEIFRNFDHLCVKHGIQKIETVGKTYMACAGLASCEIHFSSQVLKTEKTRRLVSMALEMIKYIEKITYGKGEHIKLKIGIHNGRVISGVIGYHKPQFSLIGDTVNTTSRVCSTGVEGSITVSSEAFENIKNSNIACGEPRVVQAKGKGDLITYQVLNQKKTKKTKESKLKKKIQEHMPAIRDLYEKLKAENKRNHTDFNKNNAVNYNKAVNLLQNWLVQKKIEDHEDDHLFNNEKPNEGEKSLKNEGSNVIQMMDSQFTARDDNFRESLRLKNRIFLTFEQNQSALAEDFLHLLFQKHKHESRISIFMLIPLYLINTFLMIIIQNKIDNSSFILGFRAGYLILLSFYLFFVMYNAKNSNWNRSIFFIIYCYGIISPMLFVNYTSLFFLQQVGLVEMIFIYLIFVNSNFLRFLEVLILTILTFGIWLIFYGNKSLINEKNFFFIFTIFIYNLFKINYQIRYHVESFNTILINEAKKEEQNSLAFEKLKHVNITNKIGLTDYFKNVTILFADIAGFTKYSSSVKPEDVVNMLRKLFTEFDKQCLTHKVYKVYTIGDCYVVLGFLNAAYRNPLEEAKNVVRMGFSMIEIIRSVRQLVNFPDLDMRIGVHTGDIIGGIIGTDIVRYDIYGKDVLIANKMESNGAEGNVMVSESTKRLLEKDENLGFRFKWQKAVECRVQPDPIQAYLIYQRE